MKLYIEEQVIQMIEKSRETGLTAEFLILTTTPIKLPSDEEIDEESPYVPNDASIDFWSHKEGFVDGAKWMRDKIQGGNNDQQ